MGATALKEDYSEMQGSALVHMFRNKVNKMKKDFVNSVKWFRILEKRNSFLI